MANKYITDLPLIDTLSAGDYIHVDHNNVSNSTQLSAVLKYISSEIKNNPSSLTITENNITNSSITSDKIVNSSITNEKITNNAITSEKISNNAITSEKITNNAITVDKLNSNVVNTAKGIKLDNGISVNLDETGGLMFNASGQVKIAPVAGTSNIVVVRPSDINATDSAPQARSNINGELRPCFRTLTVAAWWAQNNINGNYSIYVDEDTTEGEGANYLEPSDNTNRPANWGIINWTWNTANLTIQYTDQTTVDNIFGIGSGLKAGLYCWPRIKNQKMEGGLNFGWQLGNASKSSTVSIRSRFKRGTAPNFWWDTERYFDEAPNSVNYNVYFTNDISLDWSSSNTNSKWGLSVNRKSNWTKRLNYTDTNIGFCYIRNAGLSVFDSKASIGNINLVNRNNCNDSAPSDIQNSNLYLYNLTLSYLGTGFYNYGLVRALKNADIHVCGIALKSKQDNNYKYPGYGIAIIGNQYVAGSNLSAATLTNSFVDLNNNAYFRPVEYNAFAPNYSRINNSIIFDGDFCFNNNVFIAINSGSTIETQPNYIVNNVNIRNQRIDDLLPSRISTQTNVPLFPINFGKGVLISLYNGEIRKWTIDGTSTESGKLTSSPILMYKGSYESSEGTITGNYWVYNTTTDAYKASNIYGGDIAYRPLSAMPQLSTFYRFTENGSVSSLNYGVNVRN